VTDEQTAWRDVSRLSKRSLAAPDTPPAALLELGSGGGSPACHLKERLALTLSDRSAAHARSEPETNPECEHVLWPVPTRRLAGVDRGGGFCAERANGTLGAGRVYGQEDATESVMRLSLSPLPEPVG
jgi:hypothetical protein